jgi:hypothetical protein
MKTAVAAHSCKHILIPSRSNCAAPVCPLGTFLDTSGNTCEPCPLGAYCPGGSRTAKSSTDNLGSLISCAASGITQGITTKSLRATKPADCGKAGRAGPQQRASCQERTALYCSCLSKQQWLAAAASCQQVGQSAGGNLAPT